MNLKRAGRSELRIRNLNPHTLKTKQHIRVTQSILSETKARRGGVRLGKESRSARFRRRRRPRRKSAAAQAALPRVRDPRERRRAPARPEPERLAARAGPR